MKTIYQVYSRLKGTEEWLEDHMPFESRRTAERYIETQYKKTHQYMIITDEAFESAEEELDFNDAWDALGGDWKG